MPKPTLLDRVRKIALRLPNTEESTRLGGEPHFYVNGKIFTGCGVENGVWTFGVKVGLDLQSVMVSRPGFRVAKYVGRYGWITVEESALADPVELEELILLSYDLISVGAKEKPCNKKATTKKAATKAKKKPAAKKLAAKKAAKK